MKFANTGCTATLVVTDGKSGCAPCGALLWMVTSYSPGFCKLVPCCVPTNCRGPEEETVSKAPSSSNLTIGVLVPPKYPPSTAMEALEPWGKLSGVAETSAGPV